MDVVLFSDSTVKAATNEQQWYVTISRGRKGVKVFTADKEMLRENITRGGARMLAMDMAKSSIHALAKMWGRDAAYVLNVQKSQRQTAAIQGEELRQRELVEQAKSQQQTESLKPVEAPAVTVKPKINNSETIRPRMETKPTQPPSRGMRI